MGRVVYIASHCNSVKLSEFSFAISSAELRLTLVLVLCVCACSPFLLLPPVIVCVVSYDGEWSVHPCQRSRDQHYAISKFYVDLAEKVLPLFFPVKQN